MRLRENTVAQENAHFLITNEQIERELIKSFGQSVQIGSFSFPTPDFPSSLDQNHSILSWDELIQHGILKYKWDSYSRFIPTWEQKYHDRYLNHYAGSSEKVIQITGRRMYEQPWQFDAGSYLFSRLLNGDKKVSNLLSFGWTLRRFSDGCYRVTPPMTFKEFLEGYYTGLIHYRKKASQQGMDIGVPLVSIHDLSKLCFVRPGLDLIENQEEWRCSKEIDKDPVNAPQKDYYKAVARNIFAMQPFMFDHDLSHLIDYYTHRSVFVGNVAMMTRFAKDEPDYRLSVDPYRDFVGYALGIRFGIFHEELAIPDISRLNLIRKLIPDVFEESLLQALPSAMNHLKKRGIHSLVARSQLLADNIDRLVTRHGGGMSDSYNLFLELNVRCNAEDRVLLSLISNHATPSPLFGLGGREVFSQLAIESLYGIADDLRFLAELVSNDNVLDRWVDEKMGAYDYWEKRKKVFDLFYDRLARLQVALYKGMELQMSVGDFIEGSSQRLVSRKSKVAKYFGAFAIPGTLYFNAYCDERVLV